LVAKNHLKARFKKAQSPRGKLLAGVLLWLVVFLSKFAILELVDFVFGDRVDLGGFVSVWLLVLTLLIARAAVRWLLRASRATP
jgi:hypothetical protein